MTARTSAGAASTVMLDSVRSAMAGRLPVDLQQGAAQREQAEPEGRHRDDTQDGGHGATTGPGQERGVSWVGGALAASSASICSASLSASAVSVAAPASALVVAGAATSADATGVGVRSVKHNEHQVAADVTRAPHAEQ